MIFALEYQDVKSVLILPLLLQNSFYGFIGFDECFEENLWENEEVALLRTIADIISNFIERQLLYKQLRESEIRQKLAIENTQAGLWDWNIQTGEVYFNDIWFEMLGYNRHEVEPNVKSWERLLHPDDLDRTMNDLTTHLEGRSNCYVNVHRMRTKSGEWKWIIDKGKIIKYDKNGKPLRAIGTHIDIDNQKKAEEELRALNITKDKLFTIIAHDLRGPIGSMMQIADIISSSTRFDEKTFQKFLNTQKELSKNTRPILHMVEISWLAHHIVLQRRRW